MIATIYRVTLRAQAKKGRLAALALLGIVGVVVGLAVGLSDVEDPIRAATNMINAFGLSLYAPVVTLVFASASLGDPAEDGTLVYLWLRPVPRWQIVAGTYLATLTVALPNSVAPSPSLEGRLLACSDSFDVMLYFSLSSANSLLSSSQVSKSWT